MIGEDEQTASVDIKSRIAAFSNATLSEASKDPSKRNGAVPISVPRKPSIHKTPSTSQLLPAWQQKRQQLERQIAPHSDDFDNSNTLLKPDSLISRPRASVNEFKPEAIKFSDASSPPKLGVKNIIALYGQQGVASSGSAISSPSIESRARGGTNEISSNPKDDSRDEVSASLSAAKMTISTAAPPPSLPPRPKISAPNTTLSQSNTGSSNHSSSSTGNSINMTTNQSYKSDSVSTPQYATYVRKGTASESVSSAGSGGESTKISGPALPPRNNTPARSTDDLSLNTQSSNLNRTIKSSATIPRQLGSGPKWASSSSGQLDIASGENDSIPPAVPPRAKPVIASSSISNSSTLIPPPKRGVTSPAPPPMNRSLRPSTASLQKSPLTSHSAMANGNASQAFHRSIKSVNSASMTPPLSSSGSIAPPPRHVDIRRIEANSQDAISRRLRKEQRRAKRDQRRQRLQKRMTLQYSRDPGVAEDRYDTLFDVQLQKQQRERKDDYEPGLLDKNTVVRIWTKSRLEDWFLAKVWDAASDAEGQGVSKTAFVRAMSAIDYELARRRNAKELHHDVI